MRPSKNLSIYLQQQNFASICIVFTAMFGNFMYHHSRYFGSHMPNQWISFFLIGAMIPGTYYLYQRFFANKLDSSPILFYVNGVMFISLIAIIGMVVTKLWRTQPTGAAGLLSGFILITSCLTAYAYSSRKNSELNQHESWLVFAMTCVWTLLAWCALFQLPNWQAYQQAIIQYPGRTMIISLICWVVIFQLLNNIDLQQKHEQSLPWLKQLSFLLFILIACMLGFRADSLFRDPSYAFHWAYFVGPVETVRNRGWLLWNTPSQYGFLNILIAACLPTHSAWEAIYLLQSSLLVIVSLIFYDVLRPIKSLVSLGGALLISLCALHFADPVLEGPAAYPSSSVMRFFWCYGLLWPLYRYWRSEHSSLTALAGYGGLAWTVSALWSAESAIYGSFIFFPALAIAWFQTHKQHLTDTWQQTFFQKYRSLFLPFILLSLVIVAISIYYRITLGHYPDWTAYVMYGFLYAGGFGSYPLQAIGAVWILLLLLIGFITLLLNLAKNNLFDRSLVLLVGMIGCLWSISSYFVGRSVPNNITAILPVLTLLLWMALRLSRSSHTTVLKAFAAPFLWMIVLTVFGNPSLNTTLSTLQSFATHIETQRPHAPFERDLAALMQQADVHPNEPIAYSGLIAHLPYISQFQDQEQLWLPSPLQLLEEPVPPSHRRTIIARFVARMPAQKNYYLIHANNEVEDRYADWLLALKPFFTQSATFKNNHWTITQFQPNQH